MLAHLVACLACFPQEAEAATLEPPADPVGERLGQAWRWRDLRSDQDRPGVARVFRDREGGVLCVDQGGLFRDDGLRVIRRPSWGQVDSQKLLGVYPLPDGMVAAWSHRCAYLLDTGEVRSIGESRWSLRSEGALALVGDRLLVGLQGAIFEVLPTGLERVADAPHHAPILALAPSPDGGLVVLLTTGLWTLREATVAAQPRWTRHDTAVAFEQASVGILGRNDPILSAWNEHQACFLPAATGPPWSGILVFDGSGLSVLPCHDRQLNTFESISLSADGTLAAINRRRQVLVYWNGNWTEHTQGGWAPDRIDDLVFCGVNRLVISTAYGLARSCDLGSRRWQTFTPPGQGHHVIHDIAERTTGGPGLWLATAAGLLLFDGARFHDRTPRGSEQVERRTRLFTSVLQDRSGRLWAGSGADYHGVWRRPPGPDADWTLLDGPADLGEHRVHEIVETSDGSIWFCLLQDRNATKLVSGGLARFHDGAWTRHDSASDGLPSDAVFSVLEADGDLFVGTRAGVARFDGRRFHPLPAGRRLTGFTLAHFGGRLWLGQGSYGKGLWVRGEEEWEFVGDPLLRNVQVHDLQASAEGLWISSLEGAFLHDGEAAHPVTQEPGAPAHSYWPILRTSADTVWLGGMGAGLLRHRRVDLDPPTVFDVYVAEDASGGHALHPEARDPWGQTTVDRLRFHVEIDGHPRVTRLARNAIRVGPLRPGTHRARVWAVDLAGNRSTSPHESVFDVPPPPAPPWYERSDLLAFLASVVVLLVWLGLLVVRRTREAAELREDRRRAITASEQHYRRLAESVDLYLSHHDASGRLAYLSPGIGKLTGHPPEAYFEDSGLLTRLAHVDDRESLQGLASQREQKAPGETRAEFRLRAADGSWKWMFERQVARVDDDGSVLGYDAVAVDLSPRHELEQELRSSEQRIRRIIETCHEGVWIVGLDRVTQYANERLVELLGIEVGRLAGRAWTDFVDPEDLEKAERLQESTGTDATGQVQLRLRREEGDPVWTLVGASALTSERGATVGTLLMVADLSETKRAELAVLHARKLESLGVLANGFAHDFNDLLVGVRTSADLLKAETDGSGSAAKHLRQIETAAERASRLCQQLHAFAGSTPERLLVQDLHAICQATLGPLRPEITGGVALRPDLVDCPLPVRADGAQLREALRNLVLNAAEAMGSRGGAIAVRTGREKLDRQQLEAMHQSRGAEPGVFVWVEVEDQGPGMTRAELERIFDPFYSTRSTGRGLGLSTVAGVIRGHRGAIQVRSVPGLGTTVRLWLPACVEALELAGPNDS